MFPELLPELAFHLFCRWHFAEHEFANSENLWQGGFHFQKLKPIWRKEMYMGSIFNMEEMKSTKRSRDPTCKSFQSKAHYCRNVQYPFPPFFFGAVWRFFSNIFGSCFLPTCTKSWSPSKREHVRHATGIICIFSTALWAVLLPL